MAWGPIERTVREKAGEIRSPRQIDEENVDRRILLLQSRIQQLETALRESHGSYMALVANLEGLAFGAPLWDGPHCAREVLGIPHPTKRHITDEPVWPDG